MIPSNGVLVGEYWEPLLVLLSEQRQVAGREPRSEQRSVEQPGYLGESQLHLLRHRAPITATRPTGMATQATDIPLIGILLTDIRATHHRTTDTQDIRDTPLILVPQAMDTQATRDTPTTPVLRVLDIRVTQGIPLILVLQTTDTQARRGIQANSAPGYQSSPPYSPYSGSGYRYPVYGYPGDRASEDWSPGPD